MPRYPFSKLASPLAILMLLIVAPLVLAVMAFKRLRGATDAPLPRDEYVLIPPTNIRP